MNPQFFLRFEKSLTNTYLWARRGYWSSKDVRQSFGQFFTDKSHTFVQSSPVVPWTDPSLHFVNAGMNQFKSVFLGTQQINLKKAFNTQKCIRVGGKHNDLDDVGKDTYHHTFFEMMGNWSFEDYFKKESCQMAWELLTTVYKISPDKLYVTYFGGDSSMHLLPDTETRDIWRRIGVPEHRILPFGARDNFWEMGKTGPCGPSTEIHYDHLSTKNSASLVNQNNENVIELWNLVFVQYQRLADGSLMPLDKHFVDTGMGLERILACINGKVSNYDTDLFVPLFNKLQEMSQMPGYQGSFHGKSSERDSAYRIIADHSRMMTASLCDGLLPHDNYRLRSLIKRALILGSSQFKLKLEDNWLLEMMQTTSDILGETYPEMKTKLPVAKLLIQHEIELEHAKKKDSAWSELVSQYPELNVVSNLTPATVQGLKEVMPVLARHHGDSFPVDQASNLCAQYQISFNLLEEILSSLGKSVDNPEKIHQKPLVVKQANTVQQISSLLEGPPTICNPYIYEHDAVKQMYITKPHKATVLSLFKDGDMVECVSENDEICVILDATNFYFESGGQMGDMGQIKTGNCTIKITKTEGTHGYVLHHGKVCSGSLSRGDIASCYVDSRLRNACMQLHSAHHLFMAALKSLSGVAYQKKSNITNKMFHLDVFSYPQVELSHIEQAETIVRDWITQSAPLSRISMSFNEALKLDNISVLSGHKYPEHVHVLESSFAAKNITSRELCCGTHVHNTAHIGDFCVANVHFGQYGMMRVTAVAGNEAQIYWTNGQQILQQLQEWDTKITGALDRNEKVRGLVQPFKKWKQKCLQKTMAYSQSVEFSHRTAQLLEQLEAVLYPGSNWKELQERVREISALHTGGTLVHHIDTDFRGTQEELMNITEVLGDFPSVLTCKGWGKVRVVFKLPKCNEKFMNELFTVLHKSLGSGNGKVHECNDQEIIGHYMLLGVKREHLERRIQTILEISKA